MQKNKTMRTKT